MTHDPNQPITPRHDPKGRRLCTAHNSRGEPCGGYAMRGQNVCHKHGGATKQARNKARLRLAALVDPAITTLARELAKETNTSRDKQAAANSILDRAGYGRGQTVEVEDARALLHARIDELLGEDGEDDE